jgi:hypothetical protein
MGDAPQHQQRNNQNRRNNNNNNNNNNNQQKCTFCGKPGHLANVCRSKPNGNGNGNSNGNGNARNINMNNNNNNGPKVNPENTKPDQQCYMHPNCKTPHTNAACGNPANKWSAKNSANQNNQQNNQQQQQPQPQPFKQPPQQQQQRQNKHQEQNFEHYQRTFLQQRNAHLKERRLPIPGAEYNYCERCNTIGHQAAVCDEPAVRQFRVIVCAQCFNHGHTITECNHPAFCGKCRSVYHTKDACDQKQCPGIALKPAGIERTRAFAASAPPPRPAAVAEPMAAPQAQKAQSAPQFNQGFPNPAFVFTPPGHPVFGRAPAYFHNGQWYQVPNEISPIRQLVVELAAQQAAETARAVKAKCQTAHASYPLHLLNDAITQTDRDLATVDPSNPRIVLPANIRPTSLFERLTASWLHTGAFARAAALIRAGSNFFRDPRALDGIAKAEKPVCLTCAGPGMVLDAAFHEIVPGQVDVLTVEDHVEWGVSVAFACSCCKHQGFAWVGPNGTC